MPSNSSAKSWSHITRKTSRECMEANNTEYPIQYVLEHRRAALEVHRWARTHQMQTYSQYKHLTHTPIPASLLSSSNHRRDCSSSPKVWRSSLRHLTLARLKKDVTKVSALFERIYCLFFQNESDWTWSRDQLLFWFGFLPYFLPLFLYKCTTSVMKPCASERHEYIFTVDG